MAHHLELCECNACSQWRSMHAFAKGDNKVGPSPQHKAECDCDELIGHGGRCIWPQCESGALLKITSVAEEHRATARNEIIKARVAFYAFLAGVAATSLFVWLFVK